jgi:hypothetical protein
VILATDRNPSHFISRQADRPAFSGSAEILRFGFTLDGVIADAIAVPLEKCAILHRKCDPAFAMLRAVLEEKLLG